MPLTLLHQMQQLDALQQRTQKYYSLFTTTQQQQQRNEFLDNSNVAPQEECLFGSTQKRKTYIAPQLQQEQDHRQIYESQLITTRDDVNISRIFQGIILVDNPTKNQRPMGVQLVLQNGQIIELDLESNKNDDFSLSNFSSFNVNREEENSLEFRYLLECIQKTTGRTLNKGGIQRIITQIANQTTEINKQSPREQEKATIQNSHYLSCGESSFSNNSQLNHIFDTALNNKVFHRKRTDRQTLLQCSKNTSVLSASISVHQQKVVSPDCASKVKYKFKSNLNQDKENGLKTNPKQTLQKQLRIIRKSNPKQLLMLYSDMRQVQQFCITNKIYGKEKDKVLKAVQFNKNNILLQ